MGPFPHGEEFCGQFSVAAFEQGLLSAGSSRSQPETHQNPQESRGNSKNHILH